MVNLVFAIPLMWLGGSTQVVKPDAAFDRLRQLMEQHGTFKEVVKYSGGSSEVNAGMKVQTIGPEGFRFTENRPICDDAWDCSVSWKGIKSVAAYHASDLFSSSSTNQPDNVFKPPVPWSEIDIKLRRPQPARLIKKPNGAAIAASFELDDVSFWVDRQVNGDEIRDLIIQFAKKHGAKVEKAPPPPPSGTID